MNNQSKQRIGFVGECMIELKQMADGTLRQHYSGDVLNTAVYFRRELGQAPIDAEFITAIGKDSLSENMLQFWHDENLNCDYVARINKKLPGLYFIQVNEHGERSFNYWRNDSAAKMMFTHADSQRLLDHLQDLDGVYVSGITLAILNPPDRENLFSALEGLKRRGGKIYFDNNYRPALWSNSGHAVTEYERIMTQCDIAFLTADDEAAL
jgi:2-dehydro-3-deoxygluconokinase